MPTAAQIGFFTSLLEVAATSIGTGIVVGGFLAAVVGMFAGRTRREMEADALRVTFYGGSVGMFCLCFDLLMRYAG
jgi:hypothetical protein